MEFLLHFLIKPLSSRTRSKSIYKNYDYGQFFYAIQHILCTVVYAEKSISELLYTFIIIRFHATDTQPCLQFLIGIAEQHYLWSIIKRKLSV